ncbi:FprA family A-type flavoprotein [Thermodesulfobacteriota bacterium]
MKTMKMRDDVFRLGAIDWDRRLFDALIPLPDGTSYNAFLVCGSEKTALIDTVDPAMADVLLAQLKTVERVDFIVTHHAEQDHSGTIPMVLEKYNDAKVVATVKCKSMLMDHLGIPEHAFITVDNGETLSLGNKTLEFIHTPWVHWPETMSTYLREDRILFSCDFFGSHIATTDLYAVDESRVYEAAKRYYAEIMMPFRKIIGKNLDKIEEREIDLIAPSHGPVYNRPAFIMNAYRDWGSDDPKNVAVIPYVSMHGSTNKMVEHLVEALAERGVSVHQFDLAVTDIGKLAITLVDAATLVIGTPTVRVGAHPLAAYAAFLANILSPKARFCSIIGSYGWGTKVVEQIAALIPNLNVEILDPVICKGAPKAADWKALDHLAATIHERHIEGNFSSTDYNIR